MRVQPGETFEIETYDASTGYFKSPDDKAIPGLRPGFDRFPPQANPIGGPVYLEGAERGDTLAISLEDILVDDYSWIAIGPHRGPLGESTRWPELSSDYTTKMFQHTPGPSGTMRDGTVHFNEKIAWPITPFMGTLGVAPDREVTTSLDGQGEWGGNLDIRDVCPGNRILLPIHHAGALFYLGDVHASQGDTEFTGTAAETKATVRVRLELSRGSASPGCASRSRIDGGTVCVAALGGRRRNGDHQSDGLAHERILLYANGCLLSGEYLSGFSHQCVSNVQDWQAELCGGSGNTETIYTYAMNARTGK